jgi:hypothetical protein
MDAEPEPKISLPIALFIGVIMVICDLLELIPLAGDILDVVIGIPLDIYLFFSGINMTYALIGQGIELIPIAQELPLWTATWIMTVYVANHPKLEAIAEVAGTLEGKGVGAGTAGVVLQEAEIAEQAGQAAVMAERTAEEAARTATVVEGGAGAVQTAEKTVEAGGEVGSTAHEAERGAESGARESKREKARRKLNERFGEGGGGAGREGGYEPTEEQIAAEIAEDERLQEALGETPPPLGELEKQLFAEKTAPRVAEVANKEQNDVPRPNSNAIPIDSDRATRAKNTQDAIIKSRQREAEFEKNRDVGASDDQDIQKAA